ncbi:MAG: hypothetical protein ACI808_003125 [Paraglaciecola sp.]|jgi:hypothetical protein
MDRLLRKVFKGLYLFKNNRLNTSIMKAGFDLICIRKVVLTLLSGDTVHCTQGSPLILLKILANKRGLRKCRIPNVVSNKLTFQKCHRVSTFFVHSKIIQLNLKFFYQISHGMTHIHYFSVRNSAFMRYLKCLIICRLNEFNVIFGRHQGSCLLLSSFGNGSSTQ